MTHREAVKAAHRIWQERERLDRAAKMRAIEELLTFDVFSNRQIAAFVDAHPRVVNALSTKTNHTGGRLDPEALQPILDLIAIYERGEIDYFAVKRAVDAGASTRMVARLTGKEQRTIARHARAAAVLRGEK